MKLKYLIACGILLQTVAQAAPIGNGPFGDTEHPATVPLRELEFIKQTEETGFYRIADAQTEIRLFSKEDRGLYLELVRAGNVCFPKSLMCPPAMLNYGSAWQADLNQDGQPDYIIVASTGGVGLNADCSFVTFLLSAGPGFTLTTTTAYSFGPNDIILAGGKPRFIYASMNQVEKCNDGKEHSFWVYNLLGFEKGVMKIDNSGSAVFPKIVWYTDAPNYRETTLLTPEQKADLIRQAQTGWREKLD